MAIAPSIDPEFRDLCPVTSPDERELLRQSILKDGCYDPIRVWDMPEYPIIDGHQRYDICTNEGIPFEVTAVPLPNRKAACCWIVTHQMSRRNLTSAQRSILRGRLYNMLKKPHGGARGSKGQNVPLNSQTLTAAEVAANSFPSSTKTAKRDGQFATASTALFAKLPELEGPIQRGEIPKGTVNALAKLSTTKLATLKGKEGKALKLAVKNLIGSHDSKPPKPSKPAEPSDPAADAKSQVKVWYETIGRWLGGKPPTIDQYREQWPGPAGDRVVKAATDLYEALKAWQKAIK